MRFAKVIAKALSVGIHRACSGWKGVATSPAITLELDQIRRRLFDPPTHLTHPATTPAATAA